MTTTATHPTTNTSPLRSGEAETLEVSVVMPCLNEADTLATCITKAQTAMIEHGIVGEVIVGDNGSTDDSVEIASRLGARVVHVPEKGYGNALRSAIEASRAKFVIMGDADDSYDFLEVPRADHSVPGRPHGAPSAPFATAGGPCGSSCSTAPGGCFWFPASRWSALA